MLSVAASNSSGGSGIGFIVVAFVAIVFVVMIRRANQRRVGANVQLQSAAVIGSEVMTSSGLYGTVVGQDDEQVLLEIAPGVQVRFAKGAIARVIADDEFPAVDDTPAVAEVPLEAPEDTAPHPSAGPPDDAEDPPGDTAR